MAKVKTSKHHTLTADKTNQELLDLAAKTDNQEIRDECLRQHFRISHSYLETEYGVVPDWIKPLVKDAIKQNILPKPNWRMSKKGDFFNHAITNTGDSWVDHFGSARTPKGTTILISEPYELWPEELLELRLFCDTLNLAFRIIGKAYWNPAHTFRIEICQKGKGEEQAT